MCQVCIDLLDNYFPELSHDEKMEIMWSETAFPFVDPGTEEGRKHLGKQLEEAKKRRTFDSVKDRVNKGENVEISELVLALGARPFDIMTPEEVQKETERRNRNNDWEP